MDIDFYNASYNEINSYDSEEEEEYNELEEESDEEEQISYSQHQRRDKENVALSHIINNVLTDEQRATLKRGECFFCHKQGHFYRDCAARKIYINNRGKKPVAPKQSKQSKPRPSNTKRKSNPRKKPVDPNAMVYNFEEDEENPSDDEDF